ncbi:MAG: hypothetical protein GX197_09805 [Firmicutes bacterium]|nr:hypothetical protein [Bacillota bacterium]
MDKEKILQHFTQESERQTASLVVERAVKAEKTGEVQLTDFFDPFQQRIADNVLHFFKGLKQITWGGYDGAERARILLFPAEWQSSLADVPLSFLQAKVSKQAQGLTHRDYLGSLLGLGLRREKIGDILVLSEEKAQIIVCPEIAAFILTHWREVGRYSVTVEEIAAAELSPPPVRVREIKTTVASLRIDAVASSGFGLSRSKLTPAIRAGHVKLNWQTVKSAATAVKAGDIISVAGRGRVEVAEVQGVSKKGRIHLLLKKYT